MDLPTLVSVVIPARNAAELLPFQLEALSGQTYQGRWEVLVIDNCSIDQTAYVALDWAEKLPDLRVVRAQRRRGVNYARNVGAAAARGDLLLFCDADDVASPGWLQAMAEAARISDIVGGMVDDLALNDSRARAWRPRPLRDHLPTHMSFLPYAPGQNFGVRTTVWRALGGFDETYTSGGDETEFCWRAQLASYTISFVPHAVMHYRLRNSLWPLVRQAFGYGYSDTRLYRDFRHYGIPPSGLSAALTAWVQLIHQFSRLVSADGSGYWFYLAAIRVGRLVGSIHHRVVCL
jgi:glycosyltransferase involved in cell wall biosynthesis